MKLRTQFIITIILSGLIFVILVGLVINTNRKVDKVGRQETLAVNIAKGANELSYLADNYLVYRESQQFNLWQSRFASFANQVAGLNVERLEQQVLVRNIQANQNRLKEVFDNVASAPSIPFRNHETAFESELFQVSWSRLAIQNQALISDASRLSKMLRLQMNQLIQSRTRLIYFVVALFGVFLLIGYLMIYRRFLASLANLQAGTAVIGSGNLDFKIEEGKNDEIGDLSRAFNRMTDNLKTVTASKADLEKEITERHRAEEALREAHERAIRLARFPEENPNPIVRVSADGKVLYSNPVAADPDCWQCCIDQPLDGRLGTMVSRAMATKERIQQEAIFGERFYSVEVVPILTEGYANIYGRDITEQKKAEVALKKAHDELEELVQERTSELSEAVGNLREEIIQRRHLEETLRESENRVRFFASQYLTAQEDERRRIAGELHDSIASSLIGLKFRIEKIGEEIKQGVSIPDPLQEIPPLVNEINNEVRRIMADLRPAVLDDLGIVATMSWLCREYEKTYSHISVDRKIGILEEEVPDSLKTPIFRVSQEALNNVAKYSRASRVNISLEKEKDKIDLIIEDNGQGFDLTNTRTGLGLSTMRERAHLSGGFFEIETAPGKGTKIRIIWDI